MRPPFVSHTSAVVAMPACSQARTVSIVSVWELPEENVVQITPSAPSEAASWAEASADRCFSSAVSR